MLVLDMDDTLLTDQHTISEENKNMLLKAQEMGVYVVLASGRPTPAMYDFAYDLDLHKYGSYMLSYNGAVITDLAKNEVVFEQSLSVQDIHELYDFSISNAVHIITYLDGHVVAESESEFIDIEVKLTKMPLNKATSFKSTVSKSAVKCIMLQEPNYLKVVGEKLKLEKPHLSVTTSKPFFLEITQKGIDKAASLERLGNILGISASEMIAVGNAHNDLSMIEYAGLGVWVDNVHPELRHKGDYIVASNNDHGVAEVVKRFILEEEFSF